MITVTAAVFVRENTVLIARRKKGDRQAGKWEFPGGKLKKHETLKACLQRELKEEFGIKTSIGNRFAEHTHTDNYGTIRLIAFFAGWISGEWVLHDHDRITWVPIDRLFEFDLCPADIPIADKIKENG